MRYILNEEICLRGWKNRPFCLYFPRGKEAKDITREELLLFLQCDGAHDIDEESFDEETKKTFQLLKNSGAIQPALFGDYILPKQEYKQYPADYKRNVHWSITGACNLKCQHCFMSAPHAKHGAPSHEEIIRITDELAECGVFSVGLTGGEPLIREDFLEIIDALNEREIRVDVIFTNGWLVDDAFLDELDKRNVHPAFQLSFDGIGEHDFLRGVEGAEERTLHALKILQERDYLVSVSMCMHKKNRHVLRESVKLLASLGVRSLKCGSMMELGEWARPELRELKLSYEDELEMFEEYIPQYFEDDAPVSIMLSGVFMYTPGDENWDIYFRRECSKEDEVYAPSCGVLRNNFYIGADGVVAPCMGMGDCGYAKNFQNLKETPLKEILSGKEFHDLCFATVEEIRDHNPKCRECKYIDKCTGGCRNAVLMNSDDYYGIDPQLCWFFENNGEERITKAASEPFEAYIKRNPPKKNNEREMKLIEDPNCL